MLFKVKVYKNSSFRDKRGYYWTSWKKGLIKNLEFKHDKFSLSKKMYLGVCTEIRKLGNLSVALMVNSF